MERRDRPSVAVMEEFTSIPRAKPRWIGLAIAYRVSALVRRVLGNRRALQITLDLHWILRRFGHELSSAAFPREYANAAFPITASLLARYVPPNGRVVDVGCGEARIWDLLPSGASYLGLDYDRAGFAGARRAFAGNSRAEVRDHDVRGSLPSDARGDLAILAGVLEHIDDVDDLLGRLRAVAPLLMIEVPEYDSDPLNWSRRRLGCRWYTDDDHVREYTRELLHAHATRNGWIPVEWVHRGGTMLAVCRAGDAPA